MRTRSMLLTGLLGVLVVVAGMGPPARVQATPECPATMSGGFGNLSDDNFGCPTVGGGLSNMVSDDYATVGGGYANIASANSATVSGGYQNSAGNSATVGGGYGNSATAQFATIGGGGRTNGADPATGNRVTDVYGTVGGGGNNQAGDTTSSNRAYATVSGGKSNTASGVYATVAGGFTNLASGTYSFAAGRQARAVHGGSFVWGDGSAANISSTAPNQFIARASGGVTFYSNSAASSGVTLPAGSGSWNSLSDRNSKANIVAVDSASILQRLAAMPIQRWNYRTQDASVKHIGPMAQDFAAAFGVGENTTTISAVDADGVALAAIQGLNQKLVEKDREVAALQAEATTLRAEAAAFQERLAAVEQAQAASITAPQLTSAGLGMSWRLVVPAVGIVVVLLVVSSVCLTLLFLRPGRRWEAQ